MDLLIAANTVAQEQADKAPASGVSGWATDGNPATGQLATDAPAWHYNMMMSELLAIIQAAGITPSNSDWSQVLKAMQTIFAPAQYGVAPYSAGLAQLVGGYPLGAVVFDASGNYWRSTKANNLSVPGTDGANWVNFFSGILTQQQADLRYLLLAGGNVDGDMDWGSKTAASTVTHRFWSSGPPAAGDAAPDATLTTTGGTPGSANKGTLALAAGVLDLKGTGEVLVPDIAAFTGKDALNAKTAEGRYVVSAPAAGQQRIVSLVGNADGRAMFGDGVNNPVLANLADLPFSDANIKEQVFTATVSFVDGRGSFTFPRAFRAGTIPYVDFANVAETGGRQLWAVVGIDIAETNGVWSPMVTNTTVHVFGLGWGGGTFANLQTTNQLSVSAKGYF